MLNVQDTTVTAITFPVDSWFPYFLYTNVLTSSVLWWYFLGFKRTHLKLTTRTLVGSSTDCWALGWSPEQKKVGLFFPFVSYLSPDSPKQLTNIKTETL